MILSHGQIYSDTDRSKIEQKAITIVCLKVTVCATANCDEERNRLTIHQRPLPPLHPPTIDSSYQSTRLCKLMKLHRDGE